MNVSIFNPITRMVPMVAGPTITGIARGTTAMSYSKLNELGACFA
jgi:hypothetical protein